MKKITDIIQLPKWYGMCIVLLYSVLLSEFYSVILHLGSIDDSINSIFEIFAKISYVATILSGIVIWLLLSLLFHLTALLFDGHAPFGQMTRITSYPFIIPAAMILAGIFLLDGLETSQTEDIAVFLTNQPKFRLAMNLINYSFIPYYLIVSVFIRQICQIKYIYAALSVAIPVASIWLITELFKLI